MAINPELLSWAKTIASGVISSGLVGLFARKAWKQFIELPNQRLASENSQLKQIIRDELRAREKRIADAETALFGRPSQRPPRAELPTIPMLIETVNKRQHEDELQRRMLEERALVLPPALGLEAFAPVAPAPLIDVVEVDGRPVEKRNTPVAPKGYPRRTK